MPLYIRLVVGESGVLPTCRTVMLSELFTLRFTLRRGLLSHPRRRFRDTRFMSLF